MEIEDETVIETSKIEKIKQHIKDNKKTYITGTICFIAGAVVGVFAFTRRSVTPEEQYADFRAYIANRIKGHHNSMTNNNTFQTISQYGNPIGRPGTPVVDTTTWKRFESESLAARTLDVAPARISDHLAGRTNHVKGHTFKRVSDYVPE
jgi:hypothetical protein